jgi:hypothetical protein
MQGHLDLAASLVELYIVGIVVVDVHPVLVVLFEPNESSNCLGITGNE